MLFLFFRGLDRILEDSMGGADFLDFLDFLEFLAFLDWLD